MDLTNSLQTAMKPANALQPIADAFCQMLGQVERLVGQLDAHPVGATALVALVAIGAIVAVTVILNRHRK
ncbi:hypothetical protein AEMCBJ_33545 (plasmid) [Cupriavidus necator]|uniref:hypothetical protein n=1 Tax=Cupriavidus necator TaxID=106590 RepID=UPI003F73B733